jgi:hypothetical protein
MANQLTDEALEKAARAFAQAVNGGNWDVDYTSHQRDLWRKRVVAALAVM